MTEGKAPAGKVVAAAEIEHQANSERSERLTLAYLWVGEAGLAALGVLAQVM